MFFAPRPQVQEPRRWTKGMSPEIRSKWSIQVDDRHLTSDEIQLVAQSRVLEPSEQNAPVADDILRHFSSCEACGRRVSEQVDFRRKLSQLRSSARSPMNSDCPDPEELWELSCRVLSPERSIACLEHTAACDHCSYVLRLATEEFDRELSPEQETLLSELQRKRLQTRSATARELAVASRIARYPGKRRETAMRGPLAVRLVLAF